MFSLIETGTCVCCSHHTVARNMCHNQGDQDTCLKVHKGQTRPADTIDCAVHVAKNATGTIEDDGYVAKGRRKSGLAGAKIRNKNLPASRRKEIAKNAAAKRWSVS